MIRPIRPMNHVENSVLMALCTAISGHAKPAGTPDDEALAFALHDIVMTEDGPTPARSDPRPRALALLPWFLASCGYAYTSEIRDALDAITCGDEWPSEAPDGFDWLMVCAGLAEWDEGDGHRSVPVWRDGVIERLTECADARDEED